MTLIICTCINVKAQNIKYILYVCLFLYILVRKVHFDAIQRTWIIFVLQNILKRRSSRSAPIGESQGNKKAHDAIIDITCILVKIPHVYRFIVKTQNLFEFLIEKPLISDNINVHVEKHCKYKHFLELLYLYFIVLLAWSWDS